MNQDATRFLARLQSEPALLENLRASAPKDRAALAAAIVSLAARDGVSLRPSDVDDHLKAFNTSSGELSDAQLEAVSGGYVAFLNEIAPW